MKKSFSSLLLVSSVAISGCSMKTARTDAHDNNTETAKVEAPQENRAPSKAKDEHSAPTAETHKTDSHAADTHATVESHSTSTAHSAPAAVSSHDEHSKTAPAVDTHSSQPAASASHAESKSVDPEKSLGWLKNGNIRYMKHHLRKDGQSTKDIQRLSKGQTPHAIVLSCSDSRVPPEIVFDQKLGEIFVVRNAGEIPDDASVASIEYAVEHLGSKLIVVMGHSSCGAVKAALGTLDGGDAGSPALNALVHDIHPRLASFKGKTPTAGVEKESWANARGIAKELLSRSQILREKVSSGEVVIKSALYHLDDGKVDFDQ